ncbi:hypothetical protein [Synechococcus sp. MU1643]|uniref:hypothetical protein n=1 Tax=Synechococcus sp. MU1643 TaxID=2508349 RepID=UPI001CF923DE|nr:hypothetical protein [Synechococcus sp. MU1643]
MNNRQRQLFIAFSASMGLGLLGGLAFNVTSQLIRPGLGPASPEGPVLKGPALPEQKIDSGCFVPPGGGPAVTKNFQPC